MRKDEIELQTKLAEAMTKLADRLEKFQDPVVWQKVLTSAVEAMPSLRGTIPTPIQDLRVTPAVRVVGVSISFSEEERAKLVEQVHISIQPQLAEFNTFVKQALRDMPPDRLQRIAKEIEAGKLPVLKQRHGCIFIEAGDEDAYLPL